MAGRIQNEDIKTEAEITGAGGSPSQLPNDTKIWLTALGINKTLAQALIDGDITVGASPISSILTTASPNTPAGYLPCDGAAVSRTTYSALFAEIGVTHGQGNGTTTFNVPDYRGRMLRGVDGGAGRDPDAGTRTAMATGGNTGDNVGSVQLDKVGGHNHDFRGGGGATSQMAVANPADTGFMGAATSQGDFNGLIRSVGTNIGNESRSKNAYVHHYIKY
jgi:microcystin-dependent protein